MPGQPFASRSKLEGETLAKYLTQLRLEESSHASVRIAYTDEPELLGEHDENSVVETF